MMRGWAALVLAAGAAASVVVLCVGAVAHPDEIGPTGASLVSTALGALIGAVATYVGGGRRRTAPPPDETGAGQSADDD